MTLNCFHAVIGYVSQVLVVYSVRMAPEVVVCETSKEVPYDSKVGGQSELPGV